MMAAERIELGWDRLALMWRMRGHNFASAKYTRHHPEFMALLRSWHVVAGRPSA
jgi:hypothetical protein